VKRCTAWEGPHTRARKSVRSKEWQRGACGLTTTAIPHSPVLLGAEEVEELGMKE